MIKKKVQLSRKSSTTDRKLVEKVIETRKLLDEFGLILCGFEPGISAIVKNTSNFSAQIHLSFDHNEWKWLEPLLVELSEFRRKTEEANV